jgi:hypothetical protein
MRWRCLFRVLVVARHYMVGIIRGHDVFLSQGTLNAGMDTARSKFVEKN